MDYLKTLTFDGLVRPVSIYTVPSNATVAVGWNTMLIHDVRAVPVEDPVSKKAIGILDLVQLAPELLFPHSEEMTSELLSKSHFGTLVSVSEGEHVADVVRHMSTGAHR